MLSSMKILTEVPFSFITSEGIAKYSFYIKLKFILLNIKKIALENTLQFGNF